MVQSKAKTENVCEDRGGKMDITEGETFLEIGLQEMLLYSIAKDIGESGLYGIDISESMLKWTHRNFIHM